MTQTLVTQGNRKLGKGVWHTNLPAGPSGSCGDTVSEWCAVHCYAQKGHYMFPSVQSKYQASFELLRDDPGMFEAMLNLELAKLPAGAVFRFHTSGDIYNEEHILIIRRIVLSNPTLVFYLYTRRWMDTKMRVAIERELFGLPNLHVWGSTDPTMPAVPEGWREARVFDDAEQAQLGGFRVVCPEQTGRKASCSDCGLCWNAKPETRLAFLAH